VLAHYASKTTAPAAIVVAVVTEQSSVSSMSLNVLSRITRSASKPVASRTRLSCREARALPALAPGESLHRGDLLPEGQVDAVSHGINDTDGFDAQHPGEGEVGAGLSLAAGDFGFVDPERSHADAHLSRGHRGKWHLGHGELLGCDGAGQPNGSHRLRHGLSPSREIGNRVRRAQ
jgi:hypothetical protein